MSTGFVVFVIGLFLVPAALLWGGHRIRRAPLRRRRAFWGAVIGHSIAGVLAVTLGMMPPDAWTEGETVRGFFGLWAMLIFPVLGAIGGALSAPSERSAAR